MRALVLTARGVPNQRVDLARLTPERLAGLSAREIAAIDVNTTRERLTVGELFRMRNGDAGCLVIEGACDRFDNVGCGLAGGDIVVEGGVGEKAGRLMRAGRIDIRGSAGPWAGSGMRDGRLSIRGNAGDWLGGPLPGEMAGMRGGLLHIGGDAGAMAGDRLRRGVIVIGGGTGEFPGCRMIAGTLIVGGATGRLPGYLMRRGTIMMANRSSGMSPTFVDSGMAEPVFQRLLARTLAAHDLHLPWLLGPMRRLVGDTAIGGKGEILVPA